VDLLPAAIDVTEDIGRMERNRQKGKESEEDREINNYSQARLVGALELLIASPKQHQQRDAKKPGEQFSGGVRID